MKFNEAMTLLSSGSKVTREEWNGAVYFEMTNKEVKCFQRILAPYHFNQDIMISKGWKLVGSIDDKEYNFSDVVNELKYGLRAYHKDWRESYIYFDSSSDNLVILSMELVPFIPDFASFIAEDWIVL